jgi:hypothetical protein
VRDASDSGKVSAVKSAGSLGMFLYSEETMIIEPFLDYDWEDPPELFFDIATFEWYVPPFEPIVGLWDPSLSECDWYSYLVIPHREPS